MDILKALIPAITPSEHFPSLRHITPHELLPLSTRPALSFVIEEAVAAAIPTLMVIAGVDKDHVQQACANSSIAKVLRNTPISCLRQHEPRGLAHALWLTRSFFGKEYIPILMPDDVFLSKQSVIGQLMRIARQEKATVIAVREVQEAESEFLPLATIKKHITPNLFQVASIGRSPSMQEAPSPRYAVIGRAVISHKIFTVLNEISSPDATIEPSYFDALNMLLHHNERVFAYKVSEPHFTISTPQSWLAAQLAFSYEQSSLAPQLDAFMQKYGGDALSATPIVAGRSRGLVREAQP